MAMNLENGKQNKAIVTVNDCLGKFLEKII